MGRELLLLLLAVATEDSLYNGPLPADDAPLVDDDVASELLLPPPI